MNGGDEAQSSSAEDGLALYIHWPFCVSKCPYCDFNSHVRADIDMDAWRSALLADMAHEAARTGPRRLTSIFFGGGTPSLMPPPLAATLIEAAGQHWTFADEIEITLEANPNSVEVACFSDLAAAGVNRVSIGVQSFQDSALRFLGRAHGADEARRAIATAQRHFDRVSFDLIYALPGQSAEDWEDQLRGALDFGTGHLSLYQLTIEPGTRFETMVRRGDFMAVDADAAADLFEATQALAEAAGLPAYETSNHARPGEESRHNLTYWRYGDYAGIGPGAHGRRGRMATQRHRKPENWIAAVARNGHGCREESSLSPEDSAREAVLMGLRLREGIEPPPGALDEGAVARLVAGGLIERTGTRIATTSRGRLLLDAILREIVL